jgi:hypothetical protein
VPGHGEASETEDPWSKLARKLRTVKDHLFVSRHTHTLSLCFLGGVGGGMGGSRFALTDETFII